MDKDGEMALTETRDVVVVGAGQAGLAASYCLTQLGQDHVVLEEHGIAHAWRDQRWNSFCLVTPNWTVQLPGAAYEGPKPDGFMTRDEIATYLERYAASFEAPVRSGLRVTSVKQTSRGTFRVEAGECVIDARAVVVAAGSYRRPKVPPVASHLPAGLLQLHSSQYKNPGQLPDGAVVVVGSGQSGVQIAEELNESGRRVFLSVSGCPRVPFRYRGKQIMWWGKMGGLFDRTVDTLKSPAEKSACHPQASGTHGGHDINLRQFATDGVTLLGRIQSADAGKLVVAPDLKENLRKADEFAEALLKQLDEAVAKMGMTLPEDTNPRGVGPEVPDETHPILELDLKEAGITSVVWATGYTQDFSFVHLPVFDANGQPVQRQGVTNIPGLYFLGLEWLHKPKSGLLLGVGEDAAHITSVIASEPESESIHTEASS